LKARRQTDGSHVSPAEGDLIKLAQPGCRIRGRVGTPHWMAPEVLRGSEHTEKADVYSFGVLLWEMLSGQLPFGGLSVPQIVASVGWGRKTPPDVPNAPSELHAIMRSCLASPKCRPTFRDLLNTFVYLGSDENATVI